MADLIRLQDRIDRDKRPAGDIGAPHGRHALKTLLGIDCHARAPAKAGLVKLTGEAGRRCRQLSVRDAPIAQEKRRPRGMGLRRFEQKMVNKGRHCILPICGAGAAGKKAPAARVKSDLPRAYIHDLHWQSFCSIKHLELTIGGPKLVDLREEIKAVLDDALSLDGASAGWDDDTALLGALPELTSIAVVTVLLALEAKFGITFSDEELSADIFDTLGSIHRFIEAKIAIAA